MDPATIKVARMATMPSVRLFALAIDFTSFLLRYRSLICLKLGYSGSAWLA
jgi:hypothetical protein